MIRTRVYAIPEYTDEFLPEIELCHLDVPPHGIFHTWMSTDLPKQLDHAHPDRPTQDFVFNLLPHFLLRSTTYPLSPRFDFGFDGGMYNHLEAD